jgi:hypothetical protein
VTKVTQETSNSGFVTIGELGLRLFAVHHGLIWGVVKLLHARCTCGCREVLFCLL